MTKEEKTDRKVALVIHVHGGVVQAVYTTDPQLTVEVLDTDRPEYLTQEEAKEFEQIEARLSEIIESTEWALAF